MPAKAKNKATNKKRVLKKPAAPSDDMTSTGDEESMSSKLKQRHPVIEKPPEERALEDGKTDDGHGSRDPMHTYQDMSIYVHEQHVDIQFCLRRHCLRCFCHPQYANHNYNVDSIACEGII